LQILQDQALEQEQFFVQCGPRKEVKTKNKKNKKYQWALTLSEIPLVKVLIIVFSTNPPEEFRKKSKIKKFFHTRQFFLRVFRPKIDHLPKKRRKDTQTGAFREF